MHIMRETERSYYQRLDARMSFDWAILAYSRSVFSIIDIIHMLSIHRTCYRLFENSNGTISSRKILAVTKATNYEFYLVYDSIFNTCKQYRYRHHACKY